MKFYDIDLDLQQLLKVEPQLDRETKKPKIIQKGDRQGWTKYKAEILIKNGDNFDVEAVSFSSEHEPNLAIGSKPTVEGLRLMYWSSDTGSGITFLADTVSTSGSSSSFKPSKKTDTKTAA